ncbi:MAG: LptF/LptG family permease, partial [Holosporaceae bacterium]|nr:LptF/LptG family permease [Holosporaceae bacterium]
MNRILFKYIFQMQLKVTVFISISVFCLILLFDFAEMTRKYPISNVQETLFALKLSLLRSPSTFCEVLHYVYFIAATFSCWNLCQTHQITTLKSIGKSPRQILYPFFSFAIFIATIWLLAIHPMGLFLESLYHKNISHNASSEINCNVWIDYSQNNQMIFIKKICANKIEGLYVFNVKNSQRIFAQQALLEEDSWTLKNVTLVDQDDIKNIDTLKTFSMVSMDLIKLLAKSSAKQDIYGLYRIYKIREKDRTALKSYELELHKLLANCYSFILFALIAATICFPVIRYKTKTTITIKV